MAVYIFPPVSVTTLPPVGGATASKQDAQTALLTTINAKDFATQATLAALLTELEKKADLSETQPVSISGSVPVTGPLTDTQLRATPVPVSGTFYQATQPVSAASLPLPTGASTLAEQQTQTTRLNLLSTEAKQDAQAVLTGAVTETAPASDTASSGLNGRLQRIAQRLTSLIGLLPTALGQGTMAQSLRVVIASDQSALSVKPKAITASFDEKLTLTTVDTFTAPANAIGGKIYAKTGNPGNVVFKQGGTATTTSGIFLESGRSEDLLNGSNVSVISESGTNAVFIIWNIQA